MTASCPQSRPRPSLEAARVTPASGRCDRPGLGSAGVTGENSPHYTNLSAQRKTDRVRAKIFLLILRLAKSSTSGGTRRKLSRSEQVELLGNAAARFLSDAPEPFEQALDAVPNGHGGMSAAAANFSAADAFELEAGKQLAFLLR